MLIRYIFTLLLLLISISILGAPQPNSPSRFRLLDIDYFGMKAARFTCNRDPMSPERNCDDWKGRVSAFFNLSIIEYLYWNNEVHGEGTEAAFKSVGWHWELGIRVHPALFLYHEHHSRHLLDEDRSEELRTDEYPALKRFPVEDSFGVRLNFYTNPRPHRSFFKAGS